MAKDTNTLIENYNPEVRISGGISTKLPVDLVGAAANLNVGGNLVVTGTLSAGSETTTSQTITAASANAFTVGANGTTNPTLNVDTSIASVATGLNIQGLAAGSGIKLSVISSGTNEDIYIDPKGSGNVYLGVNGGAGVQSNRATTVQVGNSNALSVGRTGQTNPQFQVDTNTASAATGIKITGAAAGAGIAMSVISSGSNENMTINAKGSGTITVQSAIAVPAGGSAQGSLLMSSTASLGIYFGSGAPTVSAAQGSVYIRTDGSSTSTRLYINTNGSTTWTNVTTAA